MSVTIKDVAEYTNLSVTTVSLVLNGKADTVNICEATVQRVQKAAQKLNYKPNLLARSLRRGRTNIIGFVMSDVGNTFFTSLAGHIEREALRRGYRVLFGGANENDDACIDTIDAFVHLHVDGLLIVPTDGVYSRLKRLQEQNETPFVLIDRYFDGLEVDSVLMNNYRSAFDAVELLIAHGRKRIATVCYNTGLLHIEERRQGYCAALDKHGIAYSDSLMPRVSFSKIDDREMLRIMRRLIEVERVDGIIFQTNLAALAGIKAIAALGCKVPEQVEIVCFNDHSFYDLMSSPVNSLVQPLKKLGVEAVRLLVNKLDDSLHTQLKPLKHVFDAETMIIRNGREKIEKEIIK